MSVPPIKRMSYNVMYGEYPDETKTKFLINLSKEAKCDCIQTGVSTEFLDAYLSNSYSFDYIASSISYANSLGMKTIVNYAPTKTPGTTNRLDPANSSVRSKIITDFTSYINRVKNIPGLIGFDLEEPEYSFYLVDPAYHDPTDGGLGYRTTLNSLFSEMRNILRNANSSLSLSINCSTNAYHDNYGIDRMYLLSNNIIDYYTIQSNIGNNITWLFDILTQFSTYWPGMPCLPIGYIESGSGMNPLIFDQIKYIQENKQLPVGIFDNSLYIESGTGCVFYESPNPCWHTYFSQSAEWTGSSIPGLSGADKLANIGLPNDTPGQTGSLDVRSNPLGASIILNGVTQ